MPDLFEQRRDEHLKKSQAFLQEANNLFRDDLLYRSALADAVSAIKHSLQAYLWMRIAAVPPGEQRQRWQEIALDGSMPPLLRAAGEAGLQLGEADRAVRELNDLRNQRTHDSPRSPITPEQAARAVQTARTIRERVIALLPIQAAAVATRAGQRAAEPVRVAPRQGLPAAAASSATSTASSARVASRSPATSVRTIDAAPSSPAADDLDPDSEDESASSGLTGELAVLGRRPRGRLRSWWLVATAAALVLGVAAGAAVTYPLAAGHPPAWLAFASGLIPAAPTATPQPTATSAVPPGPISAGALTVTPSGCGVAPPTVTLRNTGTSPIAWAVGSPDAPGVRFAFAGAGAASSTLTGRLTPDVSATLTVSGLPSGGAHVVVVADGGTASIAVGGC